MRKLVVFLIAFAIGLGVLLWFEGWLPGLRQKHVLDTVPPKVENPSQLTEVKVPTGDKTRNVSVQLAGKLDHTQFDERLRKVYHVTAADMHSLGDGAYDLSDLEVMMFAPETEAERADIHAKQARVRLIPEPLGLDETYPVTLNDVVATLTQGAPLVPVTLRVSLLEGQIGAQDLHSDRPVDITGQGMVAHGTGLQLNGLEKSITLQSDALVELDLESGNQALLTSKGGLTARVLSTDAATGAQQIEIVARDQAMLELRGKEPVFVAGDRIVLTGSMPAGRDVRFVADSARSEGGVRLLTSEDTFTGDAAQVWFRPDGTAERARLEGQPTVALPLETPPEMRHGQAAQKLAITAAGAGPLDLSLGVVADPARGIPGAPSAFEFKGPVTVRVAALDATLVAQGGLTGSGSSTSTFSTVHAWGGVVVDAEGSHVETEELDVVSTGVGSGNATVRLVATGTTHASGKLNDGRDYDLTAARGMELVREREFFLVPRADGVHLKVAGEKGFTASADRLRDLDSRTTTFRAEEDVVIENELGTGRGTALTSFGGGAFELAGEPATATLKEGEASARWLEYSEGRVVARENAHARTQIGDREITLAGRWVAVEEHKQEGEDGSTVTVDARGLVQAMVDEPTGHFELSADRVFAEGERAAAKATPGSLTATGGVQFSWRSEFEVHGCGQKLFIDPSGSGRLDPDLGERITLSGRMPREAREFDLTGAWAEFGPERLSVEAPDLVVEGVTMPLNAPSRSGDFGRTRAVAGHMNCDRSSILFTDGAFLSPADPSDTGWSLDAANVLISASRGAMQDGGLASGDLLAWGSCIARLGGEVEAHGEALEVSRADMRATLTGAPAFLLSDRGRWESEHFEWNLETNFVRTGNGSIRSVEEGDPWSIDYVSLEQVDGPDETIQVMREPVLKREGNLVRASWMLFWVDRQEWARTTGNFYGERRARDTGMLESREARRPVAAPSLFSALSPSSPFGRMLREVYMEGNIEVFQGKERFARASSVYLDYADGHGWIEDIDIKIPWRELGVPIRLRQQTYLKIHSAWLRHSQDGSFRADEAVITTCDFEKPDYVIKSGDLRITPNESSPGAWQIIIGENAVSLPGFITLPLPRIVIPLRSQKASKASVAAKDGAAAPATTKESQAPALELPSLSDLEIDLSEASIGGLRIFSIGNSAKFGTFVGTKFDFDTSWIGDYFAGLFDINPGKVDAKASVLPAYLNARGPLLALETNISAPGVFTLDVDFDQVYDTGEDKGLVRVPQDDRSDFRSWYHARGRYLLDTEEWFDLAITYQSDPGVQAEFWEDKYLHFQETASYLHYRSADGESLLSATFGLHLNYFETEPVDSPTVNYLRGRSEIGTIGSFPIIYTSETNVGYLQRYDGDPKYFPPYPDGLGDRQEMRFTTTQSLESPIPLGFGGLILTPSVIANMSGWSQGVDEDDSPARFDVSAAADIATTLFKVYGGSVVHEITPEIGVRSAFVQETLGGVPVFYDELDIPVQGTFVDFKLRSRLVSLTSRSFLDFELYQPYATDSGTGVPDGWLPLQTYAAFLTEVEGIPVGLTHDGRYDFVSGDTFYSRTYFAFEPMPALDIETGYSSATLVTGGLLYDALSIGARWQFSPKWEVAARQTLSHTRGSLGWGGTLRRFGHDFVLEIEASYVEGEGGSFAMNFVPLIVYRRSSNGLLDRWLSDASDVPVQSIK